jgi:hypothetical protein
VNPYKSYCTNTLSPITTLPPIIFTTDLEDDEDGLSDVIQELLAMSPQLQVVGEHVLPLVEVLGLVEYPPCECLRVGPDSDL